MSDERLQDLFRQIAKLSGSANKLLGDSEAILFGPYAHAYLTVKLLRPTLRASTKRSFENQVIKHLIPAFRAVPLEKINNEAWLKWVVEMRAKENPNTRFFNARKALIEILSVARNEGHIDKIPKLDNPDEQKNVGRALSEKEILSIIWSAKRPFRFIFYVFWKMGCRPGEILRWEWSMISWNEPDHTWIEIPARISKTGRTRKIPINPDVSRRLFVRNLRGNGSKYVFPNRNGLLSPQLTYQSAWVGARKKAKVSAVAYDLRRTFITRCAAEGKPLVFVAKALDTSTKMIEAVYAKSQANVMEEILK